MTDNSVSRVITATSLFLVRGGQVMMPSKISTPSPEKVEQQKKEVGSEMRRGKARRQT